jgi:hypothetical protein
MADDPKTSEDKHLANQETTESPKASRTLPTPIENKPDGSSIKACASYKEKESSKWGFNPDSIMSVLTFMLLLIGGFTAWIFYGQFREMISQTDIATIAARQTRKDSADNSRAVEQQLKIAQQQAKAAMDTVEQDKRALTATLAQSRKALDASIAASHSDQRAYVTIGRPDGTVAEILWPKDETGKAGLVVYFQNNGRLPARFNWGAHSAFIEIVPSDPTIVTYEAWKGGGMTELPTNHLFQPMYRAKNRKGTNVQWSGTVDIAGGSSYQGVLWEVPRERMLQLINFERPFMPSGRFEYCDGFGKRVCKNFHLSYAKEPYNRFFLAMEGECSAIEMQIMHPMPDYDYWPVCEAGERKELQYTIPSLPKP